MAGLERDATLYLQVARTLAEAIRGGAIRRGQRLPSVRESARAHGVSVATVVQAYRWLEDERLIEARPRSGFFAAPGVARLPEPRPTTPPRRSARVDHGDLGHAILRLSDDPAIESFGAACPLADLFDTDRLRRTVSRVVQRHRGRLVRYPLDQGELELRQAVARYAVGLGCSLDPEGITITNGCIESVALALRAVTRPGDVVALESPTYFGFLGVLASLHLRALEIPTHPRHGISVDALELALQTQPVRAIVVVPTLSNPLGSCMPQAERRRLARLAARHAVPVIEDAINVDLCVAEEGRRAVQAHDGSGHVILCSSFSKALVPGIRLGWIHGGRWQDAIARLKATTSGGQSPVLELALAELLQQPGQETAYRQLRTTILARLEQARGLVARHFPAGTRVTQPPGGFTLWVDLPGNLDATRLYESCMAEDILVVPGSLFTASNRYRHCLRLSVSGRWDGRKCAALQRVGELAAQQA